MEQVRAYLELAYFVTGGPVLAIMAAYGLKQIWLAESAMSLNSKRESFKISASQVKYFVEEVVPCANKLHEVLKEKKISMLDSQNFKIENGDIIFEESPSDEDIKKIRDVIPEFASFMNRLESFCFPFSAKIADENIAYSSVSGSFLYCVDRVMPLIVIVSNDGAYPSVREVYAIWKKRKTHADIMKKVENLNRKASSIKPGQIIPLGME